MSGRNGAFGKGIMALLVGASLLVAAALVWLILAGAPPEPDMLKPDISLEAAAPAMPEAPHVQPPTTGAAVSAADS